MKYDIKASSLRIQQLRLQHGYTQLELAKKVNADRSYLSYVESGKKGCSVDILVQLAAIFNTSLDYIVLGEKQETNLSTAQNIHVKEEIEQLIDHLEKFKSQL